MKILLCGEGVHDVGRSGRATSHPTEGWMQPLIRRMLRDPDVDIDGVTRPQIVLLPRDQSLHRPLPHGHGGRALAAKLRATRGRYDLVVFMVDADSKERRDFDLVRREILDGLERGEGVQGVACVPMSASESWLLSDARPWTELGLVDLNLLPRRPEAAWGRPRDPAGHHPHIDFGKACADAGLADGPETRADLAERIDFAELRRKCPISFGAFAEDLSASLTEAG